MDVQAPTTIKIVGQDGDFPYQKVKNTVVKIRNDYYLKTDPDLIRIPDEEGKFRFYRKKSPLVIQDADGEWILKSQAVLTEDGVWLNKNSGDVVKIGNKLHRARYCAYINGQYYLKSDPNIVRLSNNNYELKNNVVRLSEKYYGPDRFYSKTKLDNLVETEEGYVLSGDCITVWNFELNKKVQLFHRATEHLARLSLTIDFQDKTNPQDDRLVAVYAYYKDGDLEKLPIVNFILSPNVTITIPTSLVAYFTEAKEKYIMPRYLDKMEAIKASINKNFSDLDETENLAKVFQYISKPFPGKHNIYTPDYFGKAVKGSTFRNTGALKYSFGVEFETSQGLLDNATLKALNVACVGDRSVGAGEYVTSPLQGDEGMLLIKQLTNKLSETTLVDDRCGIHVHVGSIFKPTREKPKPLTKEAPSFNKQFLINAINLGALLEPELFAAMPKNRKPTLYHCHSIRRFYGINDKNFSEYMGAYIFGPKELWYDEAKKPVKPFKFKDYELNKTRNQNSQLGTWAESRYKWLNLNHAYLNGKHKTIEFRIFSASTSFEKTHAFILTSLAFTYVADNHPELIKPGVTLAHVFAAAFPKHPKIQQFLNKFYQERTKKFNRGALYPKDHPYLVLA